MAEAVADNIPAADPADLLAREAGLRADGASPRMRDAAAALGVPEAALLEARRRNGAARRLRCPEGPGGFGALLARMPEAGEVMALTRNEACVHEKHGAFNPPDIEGAIGQVVGEIDLRLFLRHWRLGYLLDEEARSGPRRSLQFFDASGSAVHKIYLTAATDAAAFAAIAADFDDPEAPAAAFEPPAGAAERPDAEIDVAGFRAAWTALRQTHKFVPLLRRFGVTRAQAMRLAPEFARPAPVEAAHRLLDAVAASGFPIMVFAGNEGCVQIHAGPVSRIAVMGPWVNVLDPRFNLHLRQDLVASAAVVRKPSTQGDIHALELFDAAGEVIVQFFGTRPPREGERPEWRALVTGLAG
ncbi:MAG TPA: ChuX/HutX family heme-like substrate-binding protein [Amaricoccus sp.]|nr:ChuX/HutX family heme-like substrate-binding protein [Amaricoccus sp.]